MLDRLDTLPIFRLQIVNSLLSIPTLTNLLNAVPGVLYAEPNYIGQAPHSVVRYSWFKGGDHGAYQGQWAPDVMTAGRGPYCRAWCRCYGGGARHRLDLDHPALAGRLVPGFDFVDFDSNLIEGGIADPVCCIAYGHGTYVAGLVALAAPEAKIMPIRVLRPDGTGDFWLLAQAIRYAVGVAPTGVALPLDQGRCDQHQLWRIETLLADRRSARAGGAAAGRPGSGGCGGQQRPEHRL